MAEKEYIERDGLCYQLAKQATIDGQPRAIKRAARIVADFHAADVRPVVRGKWEDAMQSCHDSPHVKCSVCGEYYWRYFNEFNFCPNCGADMRGEQDV